MNCQSIEIGNIAEKYVAGQLSEPERNEFEEHYFVCQRCLDDLRVWQGVRNTLPLAERRPARPPMFWLSAIAASVLVMAGVTVMWRMGHQSAPSGSSAKVETVSPGGSLALLAKVEAPRFNPSVLRGAGDAAAARQFREAMQHYTRGEYAAAAEGLKAALALDPKAVGPRFYLGICNLLLGRTSAAVSELQHVDGLGETPYWEEAGFFLAKAFLAQEDATGAERALEATIRRAGDREQESRRLLEQLRAVRKSR